MATALTAALAVPAFAQVNKPDPLSKPDVGTANAVHNNGAMTQEKFMQDQHATDWRGSKLIGVVVYGPDNASIGDINDLLIANDGKVRGVVIGVGGFLGVGEKNVAIPLDALNISRRPDSSAIDRVTVVYTKDDLKNAPKFSYLDDAKTTTGSGVTDKMKSLTPMGDSSKK
jgi:hypothetical protein